MQSGFPQARKITVYPMYRKLIKFEEDDKNYGNNDDQILLEIVNQIVDQRFLAFISSDFVE